MTKATGSTRRNEGERRRAEGGGVNSTFTAPVGPRIRAGRIERTKGSKAPAELNGCFRSLGPLDTTRRPTAADGRRPDRWRTTKSVTFSLFSSCVTVRLVPSCESGLHTSRRPSDTRSVDEGSLKVGLASLLVAACLPIVPGVGLGAQSAPQAVIAQLPDIGERKTITEADCTATKLGTTIPARAIGEPISSLALNEPRWTAVADTTPAFCTIDGSMAPIDTASTARPINFRVVFPAAWTRARRSWAAAG